MNRHDKYMQRCVDLAQKGFLHVSPNPMVGCVIVYENQIIAEGFHRKYGEAHAEVIAINRVKNDELLQKSTLYVSLEPCAHFGKTPPCSNLIIEKKIPRVVIGCIDPYAEVAGKGIEKLKNAGVEVIVGVLENKTLELNRRFFTYHKKKRPYIVLKWAQTLDGYIDKIRNNDTPNINWITSPGTKQLTDVWRSREMAVLVGKNTVLNDNPLLTVRTIKGKNPTRIVIDRNADLPIHFNIFNDDAPTLIFNHKKNGSIGNNTTYVKIPFKDTLSEIMNFLYEREIFSVLVEGGADTLTRFIEKGIWDEARIYTGNIYFNEGVKAPQIKADNYTVSQYNNDNITVIYNRL